MFGQLFFDDEHRNAEVEKLGSLAGTRLPSLISNPLCFQELHSNTSLEASRLKCLERGWRSGGAARRRIDYRQFPPFPSRSDCSLMFDEKLIYDIECPRACCRCP
jgi:hypothetical protein